MKQLFYDAEMMRYLGEVWNADTVIETLNEWQQEWRKNNYCYGVIETRDETKSIGIAGFTENTNPDEAGVEFSWFVLPEHQNKGYATEITKAILEFVFKQLKIERVFAETHPENPASNRVLKKLGFINKGIRKHQYDYLPNFEEQVLWEIQLTDWKARNTADTK